MSLSLTRWALPSWVPSAGSWRVGRAMPWRAMTSTRSCCNLGPRGHDMPHELPKLMSLCYREHAGAITRVYKEMSQRIIDALKKRSLRMTSLESVEGRVSADTANITLITNSKGNTERLVKVSQIPYKNPFDCSVNLTFSYEKLCLLLAELNSASNFISDIMENEM